MCDGRQWNVMGWNRENTKIRTELSWEPKISLRNGSRATDAWIPDQWSAE